MSSTSLFVSCGTCCNSRPKNHFSSRYDSMCLSFGLYALLEKLKRSWESPVMVRRLTSKAAAALSPAIRPLYSVMLSETFSLC